MSDPLQRVVVGFGRFLRSRGLPIGTGRVLAFGRAVGALSPAGRAELYWAGKTTLVSRPEDFPTYDSGFDDYFGRADLDDVLRKLFEFGAKTSVSELADAPISWEIAGEADPTDGDAPIALVASGTEILRARSFDDLTASERAAVEHSIARLKVSLPERSARRTAPARAGRFDVRRTLRRSLRTQGVPFQRAWRDRRRRVRPLVLVLDVSGSMSPYARALMQFAYAAGRAGQRVEVFCFGTRFTRITAALRSADPNRALAHAAGLVSDWEGGTRIGESLRELLRRYGQSAALRSSVVVLCSDGLERGDPDMLGAQMERLGRIAHRIVWVNPLAGDPRYQPLARGMVAAMPHIDVFLPGHNLASLEALALVLSLSSTPRAARP